MRRNREVHPVKTIFCNIVEPAFGKKGHEEKAAADEEDGEVVVEEEDDNEKKQKKKKESEDEAPTTKLQQTPRSQVTGLRIYVHKLSERFDHDALVKRYPKCSSFQWANDLRLVRYIMQSPVHTKDATAANFS